MDFNYNIESNLLNLEKELINKTYKVGEYKSFYITDPKKRLIMALPYRDRVVQWSIYQELYPFYDKTFIHHSYGCRRGKGTHRAVETIRRWSRQASRKEGDHYYLKLDISKFFYRVDHNILIEILSRRLDEDVIDLLSKIIRSEELFGLPAHKEVWQAERIEGKGIPIGNLTSQLFANIYLNELDQFIKHKLKAKRYARYMDDMIIIHKDKEELKRIKDEIENFIDTKLLLELNNKTTIQKVKNGIEFVGYVIHPTHTKLRKSTRKKIRKRINYLQKQYKNKEIDFNELNKTVQSYKGVFMSFDSYNFQCSVFNKKEE